MPTFDASLPTYHLAIMMAMTFKLPDQFCLENGPSHPSKIRGFHLLVDGRYNLRLFYTVGTIIFCPPPSHYALSFGNIISCVANADELAYPFEL
jgi:hypothetical protein